jgi:ribonuclease P protein component
MVTRTGRKARCGSVVVYRVNAGGRHGQSVSRAGVIVGRGVGDAVTRHRVARLIRAELAHLLPLGRGELVVVRALPGAGAAARAILRQDVANALQRLRDKPPAAGDPGVGHAGQRPGTVTGVSR